MAPMDTYAAASLLLVLADLLAHPLVLQRNLHVHGVGTVGALEAEQLAVRQLFRKDVPVDLIGQKIGGGGRAKR